MSITDGMYQLGHAAQKLNRGSDALNETLTRIDDVLGRLGIGMEFTLPRPLHEDMTVGSDGKRVITMGFLAYARIKGRFRLVYRTVKILESRRDSALQTPGERMPLMDAPRRVRHIAVDHLPDLVGGLSASVDEVVQELDRRQNLASNVLSQLENMLAEAAPPTPGIQPIAHPYSQPDPGAAQAPKRRTVPGHLSHGRK